MEGDPTLDPAFENRLRKMARHLGKWARRQGIGCYRIYDRDVPGFPLAIDTYEGYVHAQLFERGETRAEEDDTAPDDEAEAEPDAIAERDPEPDADADADAGAHAGAESWERNVVAAIARALEAPAERVLLKRRRRQKRFGQYQRLSDRGLEIEAREGGYAFRLNLTDHLDTGLFLDHRATRALVGELAKDAHVLNLYCYTGAFTVYAAGGGARSTTSVDLSQVYLDWARDNLERNALWDPRRHRLVRADALPWLDDEARRRGSYDLIVCDPPTFSRSKRMRGVFDVRKHHGALIAACARVLAPGGQLLFSTNARRFRLDESALPEGLAVRDITAQTLPKDFEGRGPHRAFRITWAAGAGRARSR